MRQIRGSVWRSRINISAFGWEKNSDENGFNRYVCT